MITKPDLQAAIAECLGERNPNANTCVKLAAYYTIRDELFPEDEQTDTVTGIPRGGYSYAPPGEVEKKIEYYSDTEFGQAIEGRRPEEIWPIVDELVSESVKTLHPRLYDALMRKLNS